MFFYEPVNLKQWNMFKEVSGRGHVESFYGVSEMTIGDIVLLHVGSQDRRYESGVYAYGKILCSPYIDEDPTDRHYGKCRGDVEIIEIVTNKPLISHEQCKKYITQFRTVHKINEVWYDEIRKDLRMC